MPSLRPTEIGYIDRPDHPALVGPGCTEKARRAFVTGLVGGVVLGAVWGVATAYKSVLISLTVFLAFAADDYLHIRVICSGANSQVENSPAT